MINILVVEDDEKLNRLVCAHLTEHGYKTIGCLRAVEAFDRMIDTVIDLIISDIMMPEINGFKFAAMVREQDKTIPMFFMSSRDDIASKEQGFRIGIDDYMVKPVDMNELTLRVGALLRRANIANEKKLSAGSLVLNADEMTATLAGEEIPLTIREFNVLFKLLSYPRKTFTRNQLMNDFWGTENESTPRTVDVYITKLREKFAACKDFEIVTVHGLGYKAVLK
ncbi:transcriptional regulator [Treponema primitia ZAS-2]|uniref:Heme response regulator HssR n=1 Tax=Treponema primitia (strain ATCC BAA-887 / DSM 12427 / ZAS-2) TaxID=545694 RepID=F5YQN0_TREPZ|nr:response regulator transcription factor [Treponema primitia]AEF83743.1 transcriptional regulator [Treponema primitia ZAS-2]